MKLYPRLLISYIAVVLVVLAVLALTLSWLLSSFVYDQQRQQLAEAGRSVAELVPQDLEGFQLRQTLSAVDQAVGARIWVVGPQGRISQDSRGMFMQRNTQLRVPAQVFAGQEIYQIIEVEDLNTQMMLVGVPIWHEDQVLGAVLMLTPVSDVRDTLNSIYRLFWPAAGLSVLTAALIALAVARGISQPLAALSLAATSVSQGDFSQKVKETGPREIAALARSFNGMAGQLRQLEYMRRDFIASVSHELRSPMTSIRGFVQGVLEGKVAPDQQRRYLEITLNEIRRLSQLVTDLLDLSALEGKSTPMHMEETDLREIINLSLAAMEPQLQNHHRNVQLNMPEQPVLVTADKVRLQQVLINLVSNSIRHTPPDSTLTINVKQGPNIIVTLEDTGPGIAQKDLGNIFKPFYKGQGQGTGLGLAIVRALVEAHGGSIRAENTRHGSVFIINLPRA